MTKLKPYAAIFFASILWTYSLSVMSFDVNLRRSRQPIHARNEIARVKLKCVSQREMPERQNKSKGKNFVFLKSATTVAFQSQSYEKREKTIDVSLDDSVIPPPVPPIIVGATTTLLICLAIAVVTKVPDIISAFKMASARTTKSFLRKVKDLRFAKNKGALSYNIRLKFGSFQAWFDEIRMAFQRAFGSKEEVLPADDWSVCTLQERSRLGNYFLKYKFKFPSSLSVLPLELGQEITICGLDTAGQVASDSFIPLSPRRQQGCFEIVLAKSSSPSSTRTPSLIRMLNSLALGDEIAAKPGRTTLQYKGPTHPITDLVLLACGLGIVPMLQMISELLPSRESSVSSASVLWLNEKQEEFSLYSELENLFFKYHKKLDVSCIIERDLFGSSISDNPKVGEALPKFRTGTLAAVSGPDFFVGKMKDFLVWKGYPENAIVTL